MESDSRIGVLAEIFPGVIVNTRMTLVSKFQIGELSKKEIS